MPTRPAPTTALSGAELRRWYWTLAELQALARALGLATAGGKAELTERVAVALDGGTPAPPARRRPAGRQLTGPLHGGSVIPPGQRCGQLLRQYLTDRIGPGFTFDAHVREFVADGAGRTLDELVAHWHATRAAPPRPIAAQFELNRFLRRWRAAHPGQPHTAALDAWRVHRARPREPARADR